MKKIMKKFCKLSKRVILLFVIILLIILILPENNIYAKETESSASEEEILKSQQENLNIDDFINEADTYTKDVYEDIDIGELFTSAISGNIDNENILKNILHAVGGEVFHSITVLGSILVIIVIHSILRAISDGLEN